MDLKDLTESSKRQFCHALMVGLLKDIRSDIKDKTTYRVDNYEEILNWISSNFDAPTVYLKERIEILKKIED